MAGKRGGLIALIIGVLAILAGGVFMVASFVPFLAQFQPMLTMQSPGTAEVEIAAPGTYTLWHDHKTSYEGTKFDHAETPPGGFDYGLRRASDGGRIDLEALPANTRQSMQLQTREAVALGTFEVEDTGAYILEVSNPAGDERVFSLTEGDFLGSMAKLGLRLVIGLILGAGGLALVILGIVFLVRGSKARPAAPPPAPAPPAPPN